jgi:thioredoxin-like negative regulator of GroEL
MTCFSSIPEVNAASFSQRVLQSEMPALVAVCGKGGTASQTLLKLLEGWALQAQGQLRIFRLSADGSSGLAERFGVPSAPSLVLFSRGVVCYQFTGEVSRVKLDELLARASLLDVAREPEASSDRRPAVGPLRSGNVTP